MSIDSWKKGCGLITTYQEKDMDKLSDEDLDCANKTYQIIRASIGDNKTFKESHHAGHSSIADHDKVINPDESQEFNDCSPHYARDEQMWKKGIDVEEYNDEFLY